MINCPTCGKDALKDSGKKTEEKEASVLGVRFPEGVAAAGKSSQKVIIVQCSGCLSVFIHISRSVEFILTPK